MNDRKKILVTNDDGIDARGIRMLVRTLSEAADIYVCAPATEQSATGHGLTMGPGRYIDFIERQIPHTKLAYAVTGNPADCVLAGTLDLAPKGACAHFRLEFSLTDATDANLNTVNFYKDGQLLDVLPSTHFTSAWRSAGAQQE